MSIRYLLLVVSLASAEKAAPQPDGPNLKRHQAEAAYGAGQFEKAQQLYTELAQNAPAEAWLQFNAGTSALAAQDFGQAVLYLRQAEALAPRSEAIEANLNKARERRQDVLESLAYGAWAQPFAPILRRLSSGERSLLLGLSFAGALWLAQALVRSFNRRKAAAVSILATLCCTGAANSYALTRHQARSYVVCLPETVVRSSTHPDSLVRFHLHAGAEVLITDIRQGWARVRLDSTREGWALLEGLLPVLTKSADTRRPEKGDLPDA